MDTAGEPATTTGRNFFDADPALPVMLGRHLPADELARARPLLRELGDLASTELDELARTADAHPPELVPYDRHGQRIDQVDFHPAYHRMCRLGFERFGFAAMSHRAGILGWPTPVPHVLKYALSYVFVQGEFGLFCPISMTDSAARVLRRFGQPELDPYLRGLTSTDPEDRLTGAMLMTEIQGGSDVGATATRATPDGDGWTLRGRKWFASNASADVILTLARVPGGPPGTKGLGMFLVPRRLPGGGRNSYTLDRLKPKLGSRSMATAEVTLHDAYAVPVGELSRGFAQMAEMVNVSRLSNAMRSAALMRRAVFEAVAHTRHRHAFGRPLLDAPLMRRTLLPLLLHAEAALAMVLEAAAALDAADAGSEHARALVRVLTPLAKYSVCKRARTVTAECMEIRGGNGYVEDWVEPRLLRDAHLGSIWEGSSNIIALDVARALRRDGAGEALFGMLAAKLDAITDPGVARGAALLRDRLPALRERADTIAASGGDHEALAGELADDLAVTVMAALLLDQAQHAVTAGAGHRALAVANAYLDQVALEPVRRDHPPEVLAWLPRLADGSPIPPEAAAAALPPARLTQSVPLG